MCACWMAPAVLWMALEVFSNEGWIVLKYFLIVLSRNALLWNSFVPYENGTLCYLFYFYYNVITAKWLFTTITKRCLCRCTDEIVSPLLHSGYRRNSLWINPSLTGMNPVPAMWLFWTITKCCLIEYGFSIRLRANAIFYRGNAMLKHKINFLTGW